MMRVLDGFGSVFELGIKQGRSAVKVLFSTTKAPFNFAL
jgi:hypothetical protein